jgi:hypothetical protein
LAYELVALIGAEATMDAAIEPLEAARCVPLTQGVAMVPLTGGVLEEIEAIYGADREAPGRQGAGPPAAVATWAREASRHGWVAYCEAGYALGQGGQRAVVWKDGAECHRLEHDDSINQVLRFLGVTCAGTRVDEQGMLQGEDEWDAVGLGRFRYTDRWLAAAKGKDLQPNTEPPDVPR